MATVLRESQADKEEFVRTSMLCLQQQQMLLRSKLDRVCEDRLSDAIPDELWTAKSAQMYWRKGAKPEFGSSGWIRAENAERREAFEA